MLRLIIIGVAGLLLIGWLNGRDLKQCEAAGHSKEVCYATINP